MTIDRAYKLSPQVLRLMQARFNAAMNIGLALQNRRTYGTATLFHFFAGQHGEAVRVARQ